MSFWQMTATEALGLPTFAYTVPLEELSIGVNVLGYWNDRPHADPERYASVGVGEVIGVGAFDWDSLCCIDRPRLKPTSNAAMTAKKAVRSRVFLCMLSPACLFPYVPYVSGNVGNIC